VVDWDGVGGWGGGGAPLHTACTLVVAALRARYPCLRWCMRAAAWMMTALRLISWNALLCTRPLRRLCRDTATLSMLLRHLHPSRLHHVQRRSSHLCRMARACPRHLCCFPVICGLGLAFARTQKTRRGTGLEGWGSSRSKAQVLAVLHQRHIGCGGGGGGLLQNIKD